MKTVTPTRTTHVQIKDGAMVSVPTFGHFTLEIAGRPFRFEVTKDVSGFGPNNITHAKTGMKVCPVRVGATYLPGYAKETPVDRARHTLEQFIEEKGAERVRAVIGKAEDEIDARAA